MFGQDEVLVEAEGASGAATEVISFAPVLCPTPLAIYEKWFFLIRKTLAADYPRYEFVPYSTLRYRLKDISTGFQGAEGMVQSVFQALFSAEDINLYPSQIDLDRQPFE